jgi:hypothetical protein
MAKLVKLRKRVALLFITLVFSIAQIVRALPSIRAERGAIRSAKVTGVARRMLFRLARPTGSSSYISGHVLEATGTFPFVRLVPVSTSPPVPVPVLLSTAPSSIATAEAGLLHAAIGGLSGPPGRLAGPKAYPEGGCGSCGSCSSCGGCTSCSGCSSCASCTSCSSCVACTSCASCASCSGCSSCASCSSCTSCGCSCASCSSGGSSCSSCA